jgi:hypothetical protein
MFMALIVHQTAPQFLVAIESFDGYCRWSAVSYLNIWRWYKEKGYEIFI